MIRVVLADDQSMVRAGLHTILSAEPDIEVVGQAADGQEAVSLARRLKPDLVLMDIRMPRVDGLAATRELADTKVVVLTTFDLDEYVYEALVAGAAGFLVKDIPDDELVAAVRAAARGDTLLAPSVTRRLIAAYTERPRPLPIPADLTPREVEVWRLVTAGLSNTEIARGLHVGEATVKTHVSRLLAKLGARDRVQLVVQGHAAAL